MSKSSPQREGGLESLWPWAAGLIGIVGAAVALALAGTAPVRAAATEARADQAAGGAAPPAAVAPAPAQMVKVETLRPGKGLPPGPHDTVRVFYTGKLTNGTVFDSNVGKEPLEFPLDRVIPGWGIGLQQMRPGGKARLTIPSELGYGPNGTPDGSIPGGATLVFDIELLSVTPAQ